MSIQLQGNAESTFANDVTIGGNITAGDYPSPSAFISAQNLFASVNPKAATVNSCGVAAYTDGSNNGIVILRNTAGDGNIVLNGTDGTSTFKGALEVNTPGTSTYIARYRCNGGNSAMLVEETADTGGVAPVTAIVRIGKSSTTGYSIAGTGYASFENVTFNLDTGGVLDVKERLQNTQAILYRLKAALIQPDADVNTLRQRLLEALDILTLEGDES